MTKNKNIQGKELKEMSNYRNKSLLKLYIFAQHLKI